MSQQQVLEETGKSGVPKGLSVTAHRSASQDLGNMIHRCAVRIGSKTKLGEMSGQSRDVIVSITSGNAHTHSRETLSAVVNAASAVAHRADIRKMVHLVDKLAGTLAQEKPGRLPHRERN